MKKITSIDEIDALLPQTQCGLCEFSGCRPYAAALVADETTINRCPPGGIETLLALAEKLDVESSDYLVEMQQKTKPPMLAVIREEECIGCTKCIQACPTDAIIGAAKQMHVVITDACTGCELCIVPCPVDCIDMVEMPKRSPLEKKLRADLWRVRYQERTQRLNQATSQMVPDLKVPSVDERQTEIRAAYARVLAKRGM